MLQELKDKAIFDQARTHAFHYIDQIEAMDVFPSEANLANMSHFEEDLSDGYTPAKEIIEQLHQFGAPATIAQTGGRYFGFVNGGAVPVSLGVKWLADVWDQCGGLFLASPINSKLESICESWLKDIFNLPTETVAGFVSGTSMANLCGMAAARYRLLKNMGWDVNEKGLYDAPKIRIIAHEQVHACIHKTLAMLGFGRDNVEWIPSDSQGRLLLDGLPELDSTCLVFMQAGNVNTGAFDPFEEVCERANKVGAWVHVDGAFGLWAATSKSLSHLTKGLEKASSWAVDGHKTLNTPYDSGIIMCKDSDALITSLQAHADYLVKTEYREPLLYTPEMSKRSRAIELWAVMKYLGKAGIDSMVTGFHLRAKQLEKGLRAEGFSILNEVVFNQVLIACETEDLTKATLVNIQQSRECWCGSSTWNGETVIRMSICAWMTNENDIERTIAVFKKAKAAAEVSV